MRFEKLKNVFKSNGKTLKDYNGRARSVDQFIKACFENDIAMTKAMAAEGYNECIAELASAQPDKSPGEIVKEQLDADELFKDFELIEDGKGSPLLKYTNPKTQQKHMLGTVPDIDHKFMYKCLISVGRPTLDEWTKILRPHAKFLLIDIMTEAMAVETMWNNLYSGLAQIQTRYISPNAMPVALEGKGKSADYIIPFRLKDSALRDLHPYLRSFLERTENHKYLCAIIGSRLLGFRHSFIPYLVGAGGDGKSTFITFLDKVVNGYTANLDLSDSTYGLYGCMDKIFLFINDTSNKRVFYYETVKNISGNDYTRVNGKYQHAKDVKLPGLIIISSNQRPILSKAEWLSRRSRIFPISRMEKSQKDNLVDVNTAAEAMNTTSNEFINYCLQCLAEVGNTETGVVNNLPEQTLSENESPEEDEYEDFLIDLGYSIGESVQITEYAFRKKIRTKLMDQRKSDYFMENFLAYLREKKNVSRHSGYYHGIGPKVAETSGTKFVGKSAS